MGKQPTQAELNQGIKEFIKQKDLTHSPYSEKDKQYISQYIGSGGEAGKGVKGEGTLYEYYTPDYIIKLMWELVAHNDSNTNRILEPACGIGSFFNYAPSEASLTAFETNPTSARITEILYPKAKVHNHYFETAFMVAPRFTSRIKEGLTWLTDYPFDLIIGNPPYGKYQNFYSSYFTWPKVLQTEIFFMYYGLKLLRKGGLLTYIIPAGFLRNGSTYNKMKKEIGWLCRLLDAYHLPPVFAKTSIPTDIIILQRT